MELRAAWGRVLSVRQKTLSSRWYTLKFPPVVILSFTENKTRKTLNGRRKKNLLAVVMRILTKLLRLARSRRHCRFNIHLEDDKCKAFVCCLTFLFELMLAHRRDRDDVVHLQLIWIQNPLTVSFTWHHLHRLRTSSITQKFCFNLTSFPLFILPCRLVRKHLSNLVLSRPH